MFESLYKDPLTGMTNLFGLLECNMDDTFGNEGTVLFIDLKHLTKINRDNGVETGDSYIRSLAETINIEIFNRCISFEDTKCFRVGGDEFIVMLPDNDETCAQSLAVNVDNELKDRMHKLGVDGAGIYYTVWKYNSKIDSATYLLKKCYILLAESKSKGSFTSVLPFWADEMIERMLDGVKETFHLLQNSNTLAFNDDISQLPNHRAANLCLKEAIEDYRLYRKPFSLLFIDGDNLKRYNELGYQQGNDMIRKLSMLITGSLRNKDKVFRWLSGDEFVVLLKETDKADAYQLAERIRNRVEDASKEWEYAVTISTGVATCPVDGEDIDTIVMKAENANFIAKKSGKNRVI